MDPSGPRALVALPAVLAYLARVRTAWGGSLRRAVPQCVARSVCQGSSGLPALRHRLRYPADLRSRVCAAWDGSLRRAVPQYIAFVALQGDTCPGVPGGLTLRCPCWTRLVQAAGPSRPSRWPPVPAARPLRSCRPAGENMQKPWFFLPPGAGQTTSVSSLWFGRLGSLSPGSWRDVPRFQSALAWGIPPDS